MNLNFNSAENLTELVFENKNKAYGAYALRKSQKDNIAISMFLTSAFFGLLIFLVVGLSNKKIEMPDIVLPNIPVTIPFITEVIMQPKDPIVKPVEPAVKNPATISGQLVASDDHQKSDGKTTDQQNFSKNPNLLGDTSAVDPNIKEPTIIEKKVIPPVVLVPDKMPSLAGMAQFIVDNLRYPMGAKENGTQGQVYISFVVEIDGTISDIQLKKGIGDGCEQEAMRVVKKMPLWEPGIKDGKAVRVPCTLPINFRIK